MTLKVEGDSRSSQIVLQAIYTYHFLLQRFYFAIFPSYYHFCSERVWLLPWEVCQFWYKSYWLPTSKSRDTKTRTKIRLR